MSDQPFSLEEMIIARMSREFHGNAIGVGATILSDLAARLAKALRVPDMFLTTGSRAAADCDIHAKAILDEWTMAATARLSLGWEEMFQMIAQDKLQIWIGAVQLSQYGDANISVVGPWDKPKAQLIGARGLPDDMWGCERFCYYVRRHTARSFVAKVDFVCSRGRVDDTAARLVRAAQPGVAISDLGVFNFDSSDGRMQVVSLHPGVTLDQVQDKTGFALLAPDAPVPVTAAPTAEELHVIRNVIDPTGLRRLESNAASDALFVELWTKELAKQNVVARHG